MSGKDYGSIGDALEYWIKLLCIMAIIFVPLGVWKLVDIIIWIIKYVGGEG